MSAPSGPEDGKLYNSIALLDEGRVQAVRHKVDLPNYGVFDEKRVFDVGPMPGPVSFRGVRIGVPICEDIWKEEVCECLQETGSELLISPNGSPFDWPKPDQRMNVAVARVTETGLPLLYLNQVGGQDELVFDGASFVLNADAALAVQLPAWEEAMSVVEMRRANGRWSCVPGPRAVLEERESAAYHACVLGLRDYVDKNGFPGVVMGLSGGIDSALCAAMSVDALGPDARALRDAALPLHLQRQPRRRCRLRQGAGRALRHRADRRAGRGLRQGAGARCSRAGRPTLPRRTSSRERAARC